MTRYCKDKNQTTTRNSAGGRPGQDENYCIKECLTWPGSMRLQLMLAAPLFMCMILPGSKVTGTPVDMCAIYDQRFERENLGKKPLCSVNVIAHTALHHSTG